MRSNEGKDGSIVTDGRVTVECRYRGENRGTQNLCAAGWGSLQQLAHAVEAELLTGMFSMALAGDDSAGNEQQGSTFFEADGGSIRCGVRKKSEGQAAGGELGNATAVTQKS